MTQEKFMEEIGDLLMSAALDDPDTFGKDPYVFSSYVEGTMTLSTATWKVRLVVMEQDDPLYSRQA